MEDDPYSALISALRPPAGWLLTEGVVQAASPLRIEAFGNSFVGAGLRVNAQLLGGWSGQVRIESTITQIEGKLTAKDPALAAGDRVLVISADGQALYVLCKVVSG